MATTDPYRWGEFGVVPRSLCSSSSSGSSWIPRISHVAASTPANNPARPRLTMLVPHLFHVMVNFDSLATSIAALSMGSRTSNPARVAAASNKESYISEAFDWVTVKPRRFRCT